MWQELKQFVEEKNIKEIDAVKKWGFECVLIKMQQLEEANQQEKDIICYKQKVLIKTRDELINENFEIKNDGVYKKNKMYLNESDLQYLGWEMKIEFKDSEYYENDKLKGFSLSSVNGYEIDMCNIEPCMFKYI